MSSSKELWKIHGKYYDLSTFRHPGGALAIDLLRGCDATDVFEQFHLFNDNHRRILAKMPAVFEADKPTKPSAFHDEVKAMVRNHFQEKGDHKASWSHLGLIMVVLAAYGMSLVWWWQGKWRSLGTLPIFAWLLMSNMSHDGSHHAASRLPILNEIWLLAASPLLYSYSSWYMQHCLSHHRYTNDPHLDADLQHHPFAKWHKDAPTVPTPGNAALQMFWHLTAFSLSTLNMSIVHPWKFFVVPLVWGCNEYFDDDNETTFQNAKKRGKHAPHELAFFRVAGTLLRSGFFTSRRVLFGFLAWFLSLGFLAAAFLRFGLTTKALAFAFVPYIITSLIFMVVTQISHVQPDCQTPDCTASDDFFQRQARTALDYGIASPLCRFCTGGLNLQSIHHVLPSVSSSHYTALYPAYYAICQKYGCAPQQRSNILHALFTHLLHVASLAKGPRIAPLPQSPAAGIASSKKLE